MNPQANLASMERRVAAFAIEALHLFFGFVFIVAFTHRLEVGNGLELTLISIVLFTYQWAGLTNRNVGVGKVVMAISVVPTQSRPHISTFQCNARPVTRVIWLLLGKLLAINARQPLLFCMPWLIDLELLPFHPMRQTVADMICRTVVVKTPTLQPHRAPEWPMYGTHDAEFGQKLHKKDAG